MSNINFFGDVAKDSHVQTLCKSKEPTFVTNVINPRVRELNYINTLNVHILPSDRFDSDVFDYKFRFFPEYDLFTLSSFDPTDDEFDNIQEYYEWAKPEIVFTTLWPRIAYRKPHVQMQLMGILQNIWAPKTWIFGVPFNKGFVNTNGDITLIGLGMFEHHSIKVAQKV